MPGVRLPDLSNATATTPYTGGNATTLYMSASTGYAYVSCCMLRIQPAPMRFADTVRIWVQPDSVVIKAAPDTICNSGTTMMRLVPATDYYAGSIQWQSRQMVLPIPILQAPPALPIPLQHLPTTVITGQSNPFGCRHYLRDSG